ncbi:hypothetical protein ACGF8B_40070 [Streptomyces sp. NPDC047917]|uniref:hypothetical protein n=1 Tax=Streptomyces sp. NPDC047917 TaxID=3365491 RepID=UPI00371BBE54
MGIWTDAFIAPPEPTLLRSEAFGRLAVELARERVVRAPWGLLAGRLCVNASLNWGSVSGQARWDRPPVGTVLRTEEYPWDTPDLDDDPPPWGPSHEEARLLACGEKVLDILPALRAAPYGDEDIAVVFAHMDFGNRAITDYFRYEDGRTTLACFALARRQNRPLSAHDCGDMDDGPVLAVRTCVVHTFKHALGRLGLDGGPLPALASVTSRYFGPDQVSGKTWG